MSDRAAGVVQVNMTKRELRPKLAELPYKFTDSSTGTSYHRGEGRLGYGCFSTCVAVTKVGGSGESIACKVLDKSRLPKWNLEDCLQEVQLLKTLDNINIIKMVATFEQDRYVCILLERCAYSLAKLIEVRKSLTNPEIRFFAKQLVSGLSYLKLTRVIHRDIKPHNILISLDMVLKIADFGLAKSFWKKGTLLPRRIVGTPQFAAPEIFSGEPYSYPVDTWALGCSLFHASEGTVPFKPPTGVEVSWKSMKPIVTNKGLVLGFSDLGFQPLQSLIKLMLCHDPFDRILIERVTGHEFFQVGYDPPILPYDIAHRIPTELVDLDTRALAATHSPNPPPRPLSDPADRGSDSLETSEGDFPDPTEDTTRCGNFSSWETAGNITSSHSRRTTSQISFERRSALVVQSRGHSMLCSSQNQQTRLGAPMSVSPGPPPVFRMPAVHAVSPLAGIYLGRTSSSVNLHTSKFSLNLADNGNVQVSMSCETLTLNNNTQL